MISPLPADTVFEAKRRARARTALLFAVLAGIYLGIVNLAVYLVFAVETFESSRPAVIPPEVYILASLAALTVAGLHFLWARSKSLDSILGHLQARPPDLTDEAHRRFANLVEEAALACGLPGTRTVVIPTSAMNAFSVEGAGEKRAIGATEGILAHLTRPELESVVAHEAAHLAHGDSRVLSTACSLFVVFDVLSRMRVSTRGRGSGSGAILLVWFAVLIGRMLSHLVYMAISRNREYYADSEAVHMCKNPLALAGALDKISRRDRGYLAVPEGFSAMFILNPAMQAMDEVHGLAADLLSTHPPVGSRIKILMEWARESAAKVQAPAAAADSRPLFMHDEGQWKGPATPAELQAKGIRPDTWIAQGGEILPAAAVPGLSEVFGAPAAGVTALRCPRCTTPMLEEMYEGISALRCSWCRGILLPADGITRAIVRRQAVFDEKKVKEAGQFKLMPRGTLKEMCTLPHITCPKCQSPMFKRFHTEVTRVVVDVCSKPKCASVWCDPEELERIQVLIEAAEKGQWS